MNLVMICIDCLRNDFIEESYADTPFLDGLRDEGLYFSEMHSTTTNTTPCVASFFTGSYSERNGINSLREAKLSSEVTTLAEKLSEEGINTHALATGPLVEETDLDRGFDSYECRDRGKKIFTKWYEELNQKVDSLDSPFFLYIHLWELHEPIEVPEEFDKPEYGEKPYTRTLSAIDRKLEKFVNNLPEDTAVVVNGDHGESITWRGNEFQKWIKRGRSLLRYYGGLNTRPLERKANQIFDSRSEINDHFMEDGHGETIFDFNTNVPFILKAPDIESDQVTEQVRQIDIFPTLLDLFDIDSSQGESESLLPVSDVTDRKAYIRACDPDLKKKENWIKGLRYKGLKYVNYPNRNWADELYDLEKDSRELRNVEDDEKKQMMENSMPDEELQNTKELEIKEKLEDLGYS